MQEMAYKEECFNLLHLLNEKMFDGIPWLEINQDASGLIRLRDGFKNTIFLETTFVSLFLDLEAFYAGANYGTYETLNTTRKRSVANHEIP